MCCVIFINGPLSQNESLKHTDKMVELIVGVQLSKKY